MSRGVQATSIQQNETTMNDPDDLNVRPDPYVELVWENGQVMMQAQPSDQPNNNTITTDSDVSQDVTDAIESRTVRLTTMESLSGDFLLPVTSTDTGLHQQDSEMVRWFNYSIQEPTPDDYTAQMLHDLSGATFNDLSLENILPSRERKSSFSSEILRCPQPFTGNAPTESDHVTAIDSVCKTSSSICAFTSMRLQRLNPGPGTSSCVSNFHHIRSLGGSSKDLTKLKNDEKTDMIDCDNFVDSAIVGFSTSCSLKETFLENPSKEIIPNNQDVCHEDSDLNDASPNQVYGAGAEVGEVGENNVERVVTVSSVCSANSGERASSEAERDLKRKSPQNGDSDGRSEEHESESAGARQVSTVRKRTKRSRDAEVHNLSERRRRDRINEKMRALQELIPNCNKVDKASMLDEAIEYLKTLQNQVQMLLVGPGLYIPPVVLPHGMQHLNGACMSQSSHVAGMNMNMSMNMGLGGMGYGMNMLNNLNSSLKPTTFQGQQQFQGPLQFHGQQLQGPQQFLGPLQYRAQQNPIHAEPPCQGMPNSGLTIGHPCPSQAMPVPIQRAPGLPVSGALTLKIPIESNFLGLGAIAAAAHSGPSSSQEVRSQITMPIPNVIDSVTQSSIQTSNESIVRAVPSHDQSQTPNGSEAATPNPCTRIGGTQRKKNTTIDNQNTDVCPSNNSQNQRCT